MRLFALLAALCLPAISRAATVSVPVDVGIGPAAYTISGPVARDQPVHVGLKLSLAAIVDRELIRRNEGRIPAKYRQLARSVEEARITPSLLIPDALILSPRVRDTALFGITWRPLGVDVPLVRGPLRLQAGLGLLLTYAYLSSRTLPDTHFLRPGLDVGAQLEWAMSRSFLMSLGWSSGFYVPEKLGEIQSIGPLDESMWHLGQAYLQFHVRFPYKLKL